MNPLLASVSEGDPERKSIIWNVLFNTQYAHLSTDRSSEPWKEGREEPVTFPRLTTIRLCSASFPWTIEVDNEHGVTCGDVIDRLYKFLNKNLDETDWDAFPDSFRRSVAIAYKWNRSNNPGAPSARTYGPAIKRGDTLRSYTTWKGLLYDEKYILDRYASPPGVMLVVKLDSRGPPQAPQA